MKLKEFGPGGGGVTRAPLGPSIIYVTFAAQNWSKSGSPPHPHSHPHRQPQPSDLTEHKEILIFRDLETKRHCFDEGGSQLGCVGGGGSVRVMQDLR